jgi:hypothetical protein
MHKPISERMPLPTLSRHKSVQFQLVYGLNRRMRVYDVTASSWDVPVVTLIVTSTQYIYSIH